MHVCESAWLPIMCMCVHVCICTRMCVCICLDWCVSRLYCFGRPNYDENTILLTEEKYKIHNGSCIVCFKNVNILRYINKHKKIKLFLTKQKLPIHKKLVKTFFIYGIYIYIYMYKLNLGVCVCVELIIV